MLPDDIDYAHVETESGYRLEAKIPTAALDLSPLFGAQFGLDIHIIDDDSGVGIDESGRERKIAWAASEDSTWHNPSLMGESLIRIDTFAPLIWP